MKAALLQMTSSDDPTRNAGEVAERVREAADHGAELICTPEVTNCVSMDRAHQRDVMRPEDEDVTLDALRRVAAERSVWVSVGSLALTGGEGGRFVNRSFLIDPNGEIAARYDKIHMFDVEVSETEVYRESSGYAPGSRAVVAEAGPVTLGLTVCYDLRFPHLHRALTKAGASVLLVPSAFSPTTGAAHWEPLLRARAIETGSYVLAAAQTGLHSAQKGAARRTYGHSLAVSPWGEVLLDLGDDTGIGYVEIDPDSVCKARARVPSLAHDRPFDGPESNEPTNR